jgi:predicted ATPase with chaperone activity
MLARCLATILPATRLAEALETTHIHRVADLSGERTACVTTCPCRASHHTLAEVRLIGGRPDAPAGGGVPDALWDPVVG